MEGYRRVYWGYSDWVEEYLKEKDILEKGFAEPTEEKKSKVD